jgi:hypothetical protein
MESQKSLLGVAEDEGLFGKIEQYWGKMGKFEEFWEIMRKIEVAGFMYFKFA